MKYTLPGLAVEYAPRPSVQRNPGHGESSVIREPHHPQRSLVASGPKDADCFLRSSVNGVKLRNRALAPRNRSAAEHQSFAWLRERLPEYNKT